MLTPEEAEALRLSLRVAAWSVAGSLPVALAIAMVLARGRFPGKAIVESIVYLPLILPPVVTGYLLLLLLGRRGPIGSWLEENFGLVFAFRWTGAALAAAVMGLPLMVQAMRLSIEAVDRRLEAAAATLGADAFWRFLLITLPLSLPGIIAGAILSFARSLGEFGATITFVSNIPGETRTIPITIYTLTQIPGTEMQAMRLTLLSIIISLCALLVSNLLSRRLNARLQGSDASS